MLRDRPERERWARASPWLIILTAAVLAFVSLDNAWFWDDESHVATFARNLLHTGHLTGWDGRNLYGYNDGACLDESLRLVHIPPLDFLVTAGSFALFGETTWAARFPFAVAGILALVVFWRLARREFAAVPGADVYALAVLAFSVVFLLNIRQCRYYALALLFGLLTYLAFQRCLGSPRRHWIAALGVSGALLFLSHFVIGPAFLLTLAAVLLAFHARHLERAGWLRLIVAGLIFLAIVLPYAWYDQILEIARRPDFNLSKVPWYIRRPTLIWWNLRDLNLINVLPWTLIALWAGWLWGLPRHHPARRLALIAASMIVGNAALVGLLSPQPTDSLPLADVRYLILALPFAAAFLGLFLATLDRLSRPLALAVLATLVACNALSLHPANRTFRWLLPAYVNEILHPYPTVTESAVQFLRTHAAQNDTVLLLPTFLNYPILFYAGDRIILASQIDAQSTLSARALKDVNPAVFINTTFPQWVICAGKDDRSVEILNFYRRSHTEGGKTVAYRYEYEGTLDVFSQQTQRPELYWHTFGPLRSYDPVQDGVTVFRRAGP